MPEVRHLPPDLHASAVASTLIVTDYISAVNASGPSHER
jgi:hypothetical protein